MAVLDLLKLLYLQSLCGDVCVCVCVCACVCMSVSVSVPASFTYQLNTFPVPLARLWISVI